jgi:nucleotidyltransferase/DNA polymerase involved in DNA repair
MISGQAAKLLRLLGLWCIRYTPVVAVDLPDGLILDISGCAHLWGGEREYLKDMVLKLRAAGFDARAAIADTIGHSLGRRSFRTRPIVPGGAQAQAIALYRLRPCGWKLKCWTPAKVGFPPYRLVLYWIPASVLTAALW